MAKRKATAKAGTARAKKKVSKRKKADDYWIMKKHGGRGKIDTRQAPDWWVSRPDEVEAYLRSLKGVKVFEIGRSAGGRPVIAASWGERDDLPGRTCLRLSSAVGGGGADSFYGQGKRERQGLVFLGGVHGTELEGTVSALNFLNVVVTGKDLRGRKWPRMAEVGRKLRIVIIPYLNIDGRERYRELRHSLNTDLDNYMLISQGMWKDGERVRYPRSKQFWPFPPEEIASMGSYYNDAGANLVYDHGLAPTGQPETRGLMTFLQEEMPDCVVCSHSNNGGLLQQVSCFVPEHYSHRAAYLGGIIAMRNHRENMKKAKLPRVYYPYTFYQTDLIYHVCGALSFIIEFPSGIGNIPDTLDELLDIGMYTMEEIAAFGVGYGFRPREPIQDGRTAQWPQKPKP